MSKTMRPFERTSRGWSENRAKCRGADIICRGFWEHFKRTYIYLLHVNGLSGKINERLMKLAASRRETTAGGRPTLSAPRTASPVQKWFKIIGRLFINVWNPEVRRKIRHPPPTQNFWQFSFLYIEGRLPGLVSKSFWIASILTGGTAVD